MVEMKRQMREIHGVQPDCIPIQQLVTDNVPVVLRGLVSSWGITRAALQSPKDAMDYICRFYNGRQVNASVGDPGIQGRLFYTDDFSRLNFSVEKVRVDEFLKRIESHFDDALAPTMYIGSTVVDSCLPGFRSENDLGFSASGIDAPPAIWIGNRTVASCHYDSPNNIACCVVGRRRFTLFPPDQIFNLYPGPLEPTPGGQAISLVDFSAPDFEKFPGFREALNFAQVVEVEPGDAVFIPSMWWHHVQGLSAFNTLVNYWWSSVPAYMPTPMHALYHAIWALRDRPESEKQAWNQVFKYYVFGPAELAGEHLPQAARGFLGPITDDQARLMRAMLINKLNR